MDVDAKRPGKAQWGQGRVKNWQNLADIFYGWPLRCTITYAYFSVQYKETLKDSGMAIPLSENVLGLPFMVTLDI